MTLGKKIKSLRKWVGQHLSKLKDGETVSFRPCGHLMKGKIESEKLCTIEPNKDFESLQKSDIVLCKGKRFQISNNCGRINGWIGANAIFGKCVMIEN